MAELTLTVGLYTFSEKLMVFVYFIISLVCCSAYIMYCNANFYNHLKKWVWLALLSTVFAVIGRAKRATL